MQRVRARRRNAKKRKRTREPLAEGIREKKPKGFFSKMSDDELAGHAKRFMKENKISGRGELQKADSGLYEILRKRKLLDKVGFDEKRRDWASMSDGLLVDYAKRFMKDKGIIRRGELEDADCGLYEILRKRKLLDRVGFEEKRRRKQRDWRSFSDARLVEHARKFMAKEGISGRGELSKADGGLYEALRVRKLLDMVGFEEKRRDWRLFSDVQLVEHAKQFMEEEGINDRGALEKADSGLYQTLHNRKLLDRVGFEEKYRNWSSFSDAQLVEHAKKFMEEKGICFRGELKKADGGLYTVLLRRKLLDRVFVEIEQAKEREEAQALFDGLKEFAA